MKFINSNDDSILSKKIAVYFLQCVSLIIVFLGMFFSIFSAINHISIKVLSVNISGIVFGVLVFYLGIKYYLSVCNLKEKLLKNKYKFSWSNFNFQKGRKISSFIKGKF